MSMASVKGRTRRISGDLKVDKPMTNINIFTAVKPPTEGVSLYVFLALPLFHITHVSSDLPVWAGLDEWADPGSWHIMRQAEVNHPDSVGLLCMIHQHHILQLQVRVDDPSSL